MEANYNSEDLFDHHGVSAVIKNKDGEVLMQEHVKYGFLDNSCRKNKN